MVQRSVRGRAGVIGIETWPQLFEPKSRGCGLEAAVVPHHVGFRGLQIAHAPQSAVVKGFGCRPIRDRSARTEGRRSKASREGTRGGRRVAAYGDLTAGPLARAMRWSAEQPGADPLR